MAKPKVKSVSISRSGTSTSIVATWTKSGTVSGYKYTLHAAKGGKWYGYATGTFAKNITTATLSGPPADYTTVKLTVTPQYTTTTGSGKNKKTVTKDGTRKTSANMQNPAYKDKVGDDTARRAAPPVPSAPSAAFVSGSTSDVYVSGFGVSTSLEARVYLYKQVDGEAEQLVGDYAPGIAGVTLKGLPAGTYVKFRAASRNTYGDTWSASSTWSPILYTPSLPVANLEAEPTGSGTVELSWQRISGYADATAVEWSPRPDFRPGTEGNGSASLDDETAYTATVDTSVATTWHFRVRVSKSSMPSEWAVYGPVKVGTTPTAATTYATDGSYPSSGTATLRWSHNCEDGCTVKASRVWTRVKHADGTWEDAAEATTGAGALSYDLPLSGMADGDEVHWKVQTESVVDTWGEYSAERSFMVYSSPTLSLSATGGDGESALGEDGLASFPLTIGFALTNTAHGAVMFGAWITCEDENTAPGADGIETTDAPGTTVWRGDVQDGDEGWASGTSATIEVGSGNRIVNGNRYTIHAVAALSNGLRATAEATFEAKWDDAVPVPFMRFGDADGYAAVIYPCCEALDANGDPIPLTDGQGNPVYWEGNADDPMNVLEEGVTLALYRIDAHGMSELVQDGIANGYGSVVIDPHPTLNGCAYRLVAKRDATGATAYEEDEAYVDCQSVLIQWDEPSERAEEGVATFSMLELPYDIQLANDADYDVSFADYYGNAHPVARFGTQLGMSSTWSADIVYARDSDELRLARRLQVLQGTCYVREPSGTGYPAVVKVSERLSGAGLVALTFKVTRVEG